MMILDKHEIIFFLVTIFVLVLILVMVLVMTLVMILVRLLVIHAHSYPPVSYYISECCIHMQHTHATHMQQTHTYNTRIHTHHTHTPGGVASSSRMHVPSPKFSNTPKGDPLPSPKWMWVWVYVCVCESVFVSVSVSVIVIVSVSVGIEMGCNASSLRQQYIDGTHTYVTIWIVNWRLSMMLIWNCSFIIDRWWWWFEIVHLLLTNDDDDFG